MNELQVFNYGDTPVRTVLLDDAPWWVLNDVCGVLNLSNSRRVAERLDEDEKGVTLSDTPGGPQQMTIINESGLYKVILRSDKPEAKAFTRWVTHEVLPAIRKTGAYSMSPDEPKSPKARALTTDDFINASHLISSCRDDRLPYVIGLLEQGGFKLPKPEAVPKPRAATAEAEEITHKSDGQFKTLDLNDFLSFCK